MSDYSKDLSAFLDGELSPERTREIEAALAAEPALQAELEALMDADGAAQDVFAQMLEEPIPEALTATIQDAPPPGTANLVHPPAGRRWLVAASLAMALGLGGAGGYLTGRSQGTELASARDWLSDIADYHRVYAAQSRHLVEVPATEAAHIQTWLSASVGTEVTIPDLTAQALTFQGARLLVAAGKPVAQLMYTTADGRVVALCLIQSASPRDGFATRSIGAFDMVTWGVGTANAVVVGDAGHGDLKAIAQSAAIQI